nr:hypothetical protein [Tanacetum cinerariifolium]
MFSQEIDEEPHPPNFDSKPAYIEFMPHEDDVFPAEEQPLSAAFLPTTDSPSYITESDLEEKDDKDPKEDPTDYPTDRDDDDDDDEKEDSFKDDADDEEEDEEEEHQSLADSVPPPAYRTTARMSV